jgi:hypothetical protein
MPTVLLLLGWRFFFYSNEGQEPPHIHVRKADKEGKFWLLEDAYDIQVAFTYNFSPKDLRDVRRIIFQHFDELLRAWKDIHQGS